MFISKKRFETELEKARKEAVEKVWTARRTDDRFAEVHDRIDHLCEAMAKIEKKMCENIEGGNYNA